MPFATPSPNESSPPDPKPERGVRLRSVTRLDSGVASELEAILAPAEAEGRLLIVSETSRTFARGGALAVLTQIDHTARRVRCSGPASDGGELALESRDQVVNVPVQLLLAPLARSDAQEVRAEMAVCRGKPRVIAVEGRRTRERSWPGRPRVVEVEYSLSRNSWLGALAGFVAPRARFWLDASAPSPWLAHQLPLEPGGEPLFVVREGVALDAKLLAN